jgi:hypothetical protein
MNHPWIWLLITLFLLGLCTYLPIKIKDNRTRQLVNWYVLIPVSLILILYAYPAGIEVFKKLALTGQH